jgi:hypothetical protein
MRFASKVVLAIAPWLVACHCPTEQVGFSPALATQFAAPGTSYVDGCPVAVDRHNETVPAATEPHFYAGNLDRESTRHAAENGQTDCVYTVHPRCM